MKLIFSQSYEEASMFKIASQRTGNWTTTVFRKLFEKLPPKVQQQANQAYISMIVNPNSVHIKTINKSKSSAFPTYSADLPQDYRALGIRVGECFVWYWIGSHEDYNRVVDRPAPEEAVSMAKYIQQNSACNQKAVQKYRESLINKQKQDAMQQVQPPQTVKPPQVVKNPQTVKPSNVVQKSKL